MKLLQYSPLGYVTKAWELKLATRNQNFPGKFSLIDLDKTAKSNYFYVVSSAGGQTPQVEWMTIDRYDKSKPPKTAAIHT